MIDLTCWGCGYAGRVPGRYSGLRVTCKRCGTVNVAPSEPTREDFPYDWLPAVDPETESDTREIECYAPEIVS